jgi:hypothetical protein
MTAQALIEVGVPPGAHLLMIGHSYGADTALDLAADPEFTSRYRVEGVVAAGYHSQPQLAHVDDDIEVLVVQNKVDLVVWAERLMPHSKNRDPDNRDPDNRDPDYRDPDYRGQEGRHPEDLSAGSSDETEDRTRHRVVTFTGGWRGAGHHVANYVDVFRQAEPDPAIARFLDTMTRAGFRASPFMVAVDVSVPGRDSTTSNLGSSRQP